MNYGAPDYAATYVALDGNTPIGKYKCTAADPLGLRPKTALSRHDYATAEAAGFDMDQFQVAPSRYVRC